MILGSKASTYAILAVIEIARNQLEGKGSGSMRAAEIAKQFNLPAAYAAKVMTQLVRANVLHSDRGPRGGFRLTRGSEDVTMLEIIEAVDGHFEVEPGLQGSPETRGTLAGVNKVFEDVIAGVRDVLGKRTVSNFIEAIPSADVSVEQIVRESPIIPAIVPAIDSEVAAVSEISPISH